MLEYKNASEEFAPQITKLVQETIASVYPKYYPKEVVDFLPDCTVKMQSEKTSGTEI